MVACSRSVLHTAADLSPVQAAVPLVNSRLVQQVHAGVSAARNTGLAAATGDYVLFFDSDDRISTELLDAIRGAVGGGTIDVVCCGWDTVGPAGELQRRYFDVHPMLPGEMTGVEALRCRTVDRSLRLWTSSAAYRRSYLEEVGLRFSPGCDVGEDLEFGYRALLHARNVFFVPKVLAVYRKRPASTTSSSSVERFDSILALRRVLRELEDDGRPELAEITEHFRRNKELVNYFHTLEGCLRFRKAVSPTGILREIDERFPGLNAEVRRAVRAQRRSSGDSSRPLPCLGGPGFGSVVGATGCFRRGLGQADPLQRSVVRRYSQADDFCWSLAPITRSLRVSTAFKGPSSSDLNSSHERSNRTPASMARGRAETCSSENTTFRVSTLSTRPSRAVMNRTECEVTVPPSVVARPASRAKPNARRAIASTLEPSTAVGSRLSESVRSVRPSTIRSIRFSAGAFRISGSTEVPVTDSTLMASCGSGTPAAFASSVTARSNLAAATGDSIIGATTL